MSKSRASVNHHSHLQVYKSEADILQDQLQDRFGEPGR